MIGTGHIRKVPRPSPQRIGAACVAAQCRAFLAAPACGLERRHVVRNSRRAPVRARP